MEAIREDIGPGDAELLTRYLRDHAAEAFEHIVRRHVDLVYSAARAVVRDRSLAEDVTQDVFLFLLQKAGTLHDRQDLGGWLFHVATLKGREVLRKRSREQKKIERLGRESTRNEPMGPQSWQEMEPHLIDALGQLAEPERDAVVLRYLQRRPYDWIAERMAVSEPAARQRVHRALEKLRELLARKGFAATAPVLGAAIKLNAVHPAPAELTAKTIAVGAKFSAAAAAKGSLAPLTLVKSKVLAALILATTIVAGGTIAAVLVHRAHSESLYLDASPGPNSTGRSQPGGVGGNPGPGPQPAARTVHQPFQVVHAIAYDEHRGTRTVAGFVGYINAGDWLRFDNVDLGPPEMQPATFTATVACPDTYAGAKIELHTEDVDGPLVGTLAVQSTGGYGNWRPESVPLAGGAGVHTLFLKFGGGGWNLDTFKITLPRRPGTGYIRAVGFNEGYDVQTRNDVVCETENGSWVRYNGLDFGSAGVNSIAITYACGQARTIGTIAVHLDGSNGPVLAEMPAQKTGGWGSFVRRVVPLEHVSGTHDVVLTFSGTGHGIADVRGIEFLTGASDSMNAPVTGQGTLLPTTRSLSGTSIPRGERR